MFADFVVKPDGQRPHGRPWCMSELGIIKIDFQEVEWGLAWIGLA